MVHIFWQRMRQIALLLPAQMKKSHYRQHVAQQGMSPLRTGQVAHMVLLSLLLLIAGMGTVAQQPSVTRNGSTAAITTIVNVASDALPTLVAARVGDINASYRRVVATMRADGMVTLTLRDHDNGLRYTLTQPVGTKVVTRKTDGGTAVLTRLPAVPEQIDLEKYPFPTADIATIKKGQQVVTRDPITGKTEIKTVAQTFVHTVNEIIQLDLADKTTGKTVESIKGTPEHPFFTPNGMVEMGKLKPGMEVSTRNTDELLTVKAIQREQHPEGIPVYNFEVEGDHTYFVGQANGGTWVHNTCPDLIVPGRVQSRINISNKGWDHAVGRHYPPGTGSQFTINQDELRELLQSKDIVRSPIIRELQSKEGVQYVREINIGRPIGLDKYASNNPTSLLTILSDVKGNLRTAMVPPQ